MWYYAQSNAPVGPITFDDLAGRIRTGVVTPETLVFTAGMSNGRPQRTRRSWPRCLPAPRRRRRHRRRSGGAPMT